MMQLTVIVGFGVHWSVSCLQTILNAELGNAIIHPARKFSITARDLRNGGS